MHASSMRWAGLFSIIVRFVLFFGLFLCFVVCFWVFCFVLSCPVVVLSPAWSWPVSNCTPDPCPPSSRRSKVKVKVQVRSTVRPSKKLPIFLFFIQSGKVPKVRGWAGWEGSDRVWTQLIDRGGLFEGWCWLLFLWFCRQAPFFCT
jgi:hypothetical protein